jgi:ribonuclease T1
MKKTSAFLKFLYLIPVLAVSLGATAFSATAASSKQPKILSSLLSSASGMGIDVESVSAVPEVKAGIPDEPSVSAITRAGSPDLAPGRGFSPAVNDPKRNTKLMEIISKIYNGQPLDFPKDGIVFGNKEGRLPPMPNGFYREYTVVPPGRHSGDGYDNVNIGGKDYVVGQMIGQRGPERLVIGGSKLIYYSPDHYVTFILLQIVR